MFAVLIENLNMGEYFDWVNVDKEEYICPADFAMAVNGLKLLNGEMLFS